MGLQHREDSSIVCPLALHASLAFSLPSRASAVFEVVLAPLCGTENSTSAPTRR